MSEGKRHIFNLFGRNASAAVAEGARGTPAKGTPATSARIPVPLDEPLKLFDGASSMQVADFLDVLLFRIDNKPHPCGLERYARRLIGELDLPVLREAAAKSVLSLARIERSNSFYINFGTLGLSRDENAAVLAAEAVLNRLLHALDVMGVGLGEATFSYSEEAYSAIDEAAFAETGVLAPRLFGTVEEDNPWGKLGTVACVPGGEWDVRTRFIGMVEKLNVLTRLDYDVHACVAEGVFSVSVSAAAPEAMPGSRFDELTHTWCEIDDAERVKRAREHDSRVVLMFAAAAFAAGAAIKHVYVRIDGMGEGSTRYLYTFDRAEFLGHYVPRLQGVLHRPLAEQPCLRFIAPAFSMHGMPACTPPAYRVAPQDDNRVLPQSLRELLLADYAYELEVMEGDANAYTRRLSAIRDAADSAPLEEICSALFDLTAELEAACVVKELEATAPVLSQYCDNYVGRIVLPILSQDPNLRVLRVPDALYFAQHEICGIYMKLGEHELALAEARKLVDMAQTSVHAHLTMINALAHLHRFDEVIEAAKRALRMTVDRQTTCYLLYRMAFAYWGLRDYDTALACYILVSPQDPMYEVAQSEMKTLMGEAGRSEAMTFDEAREAATQAGIEFPPVRELGIQLADAATLLVDNGFFFLGARCVQMVARIMDSDELAVLRRSLE